MIEQPLTSSCHSVGSIRQGVSLRDKNWFKTGGLARWYSAPATPQEFQQALDFANSNKLEVFILGEGANILMSDDGFDGLVIKPNLTAIAVHDIDNNHAFVEAQAGVSFPDLIAYCLTHQLVGLEEFSGIPGNVGGSVFINIHYFEFLLSHFLTHAQVINRHTGIISTVENTWFNFGYNFSTLHAQEHYLISATFKLKKVSVLDVAYARGRSAEIIRHRSKRYPQSGTCGSFFRNFNDAEVAATPNKLTFVAYYLDKLGVKGQLCVGDAIVSHQHANMIVNRGNATSHDIIALARTMQELVYNNFGITPQPECQLIGFKHYPLL